MKKRVSCFLFLLSLFLLFSACSPLPPEPKTEPESLTQESVLPSGEETFSLENIPPYTKDAFVVLEGNVPSFTPEEITSVSFESYSSLDALGRCGVAVASIGRDLMPTEERGSIGQVKPSGWQTVKYDHVDGKYLYNRCHLIGFQLTGENANERNLITGTRYLNVNGMLPFENMVADYVKETGNHVMYRITPIFIGEELVARGVEMEALSVEDNGEGITFHVYCYNTQPYVEIHYATGESRDLGFSEEGETAQTKETYILNTSSQKIHKETCPYAKDISEKNKKEISEPLSSLLSQGYSKCKNCFS